MVRVFGADFWYVRHEPKRFATGLNCATVNVFVTHIVLLQHIVNSVLLRCIFSSFQ